jgi:AcrR family transcriptional regulator
MNKGSISKAAEPARRAYTSSLREQQAGQTREKILATVAGLLREGEMEDLSYNLVAERSGVSVPTIYRYFPSRKALLDGMDRWLARELKRPPLPKDLDELMAFTPDFFRYYDEAKDLLNAARVSALLREANKPGQKERDRVFAEMFAPYTKGLPGERADAVHALVRILYSFDSFLLMQERFGVGPAQAAETVIWATKALLSALEKEGGKPARTKRRIP